MPISKEKNLIIIHIPRNAGKFIEDRYGMSDNPNSEKNQDNRSIISTISRVLIKLDKKSQFFAKNNARRIFDIGLVGQHLTLVEMQLYGLIPRDLYGFRIVTSVRSPYTRALSLYCHVVKQNKWGQSDFEDFCRNWVKDFSFNFNHALLSKKRLQSDFLIDINGNINQNINLIRFENLINELEIFENKNNIRAINYEKKKINNSNFQKPKLSNKAINYINESYSKDFEILSYEKIT